MTRSLPADRPFTHPGVLVGGAQLDALRERVTSGRRPWLKAYRDMRDSRYGSHEYRARPRTDVSCPSGDHAGPGCVEEREDAIAAYTQALLFTVTGERRHAAKATEIMDAWSARLKRHTHADAGLQAGWAGSTWARAAEIVRHTPGADWPEDRVRRFEAMLRTAHLPYVTGRAPDRDGGRDLVTTDAALSIAVFLEDRATFDAALRRFRERVPTFFHLRKDGLTQETCRGFAHVGHAVAATAHVAETARHQGVDLYDDDTAARLKAALELHAPYQEGAPAPGWLCGGRVERDMGPDLEVALNQLENRLGTPLPATRRLVAHSRPAGTDDHFVAWETLTHADAP
ncbi:alginate lyase family protein [Streptomyces sp. NPDC091377]|uniref:alginate lyase family protein n=1 Tax=Streptomyces sp. NPDC091377 TaxID=3365995 RepID=UPI00382E89BD